ncbi:MAG: DUF882 domain-containing protein [Vampirovibrionales bacterium]|nr:DUF882 domain-containing protein [Vampirovibrionales bacterium]
MIFAALAAIVGGIFGWSQTKVGKANAAANDLVGDVRGFNYDPPQDINNLLKAYPASVPPPPPLPNLTRLSSIFTTADPFSVSTVAGGKVVPQPLTPTGSQSNSGGFTGALSPEAAQAAAARGDVRFMQQPMSRYFYWSDAFTSQQATAAAIKKTPLSIFRAAAQTAAKLDAVNDYLSAKANKRVQIVVKGHSFIRYAPVSTVGGTATKSPHMQGKAVDFHVAGYADVRGNQRIQAWLMQNRKGLGIGIEKTNQSYSHIDLGGVRVFDNVTGYPLLSDAAINNFIANYK